VLAPALPYPGPAFRRYFATSNADTRSTGGLTIFLLREEMAAGLGGELEPTAAKLPHQVLPTARRLQTGRRFIGSSGQREFTNRQGTMFRYELKLQDGDDAGTSESTRCDWQAGEELRAAGNVRYRVTAVVPIERVAEFIDKPLTGLLEVERF